MRGVLGDGNGLDLADGVHGWLPFLELPEHPPQEGVSSDLFWLKSLPRIELLEVLLHVILDTHIEGLAQWFVLKAF